MAYLLRWYEVLLLMVIGAGFILELQAGDKLWLILHVLVTAYLLWTHDLGSSVHLTRRGSGVRIECQHGQVLDFWVDDDESEGS